MEKLKENIANNIVELRKIYNLSQADLAEKLNFTDKTISKWERGESTPDIKSLSNIANMFNLSIDDLINKDLKSENITESKKTSMHKDITKLALFITTIWLIGTVIFAYYSLYKPQVSGTWMAFCWPVPASGLFLSIIFLAYKKRKLAPFAVSFTLWTLLAAIYLQKLVLGENIWIIFIIGVPIQLLLIITYWINKE